MTTVSPVLEGVFATEGRGPGCVLVLGTGGVGGSTVAVALSLAAASRGADVLLVAIGPTEGLGPLLGGPEIDDRRRELCRVEGAGRVRGMTVSVERAFGDLFEFKGVGGFLRRAATAASVPMITAATPGLRPLLQLGVIEDMQRRGSADLIVVDCPAASAGSSFLVAPVQLSDVIRAPEALSRAERVRTMYHDPARSALLLVAGPDDASSESAIRLVDDVAVTGLAVLPPVLNRCWPERRGLDVPASAAAAAQGIELGAATAGALESATAFATGVLEPQHRARRRLEDRIGAPAVELPRLVTTTVGPDELRRLASQLMVVAR